MEFGASLTHRSHRAVKKISQAAIFVKKKKAMAPKLSEEEIDDLIYFARAGEGADLTELLSTIAAREGVSAGEVLVLAKDEDIVKSICTHLASLPKPEDKKAYLDAGNEYGNTGLHWAAMGGHFEVVKTLVAEGAAPALANDKNYVPLDLAGLNDHRAVVDYFLDQARALEVEEEAGAADGAAAAVGDMEIGDGKRKGEEGAGKASEGGDGKANRS
ncbi:hypothetical protein RB594_009159 [Gaeumannomyces avenae]